MNSTQARRWDGNVLHDRLRGDDLERGRGFRECGGGGSIKGFVPCQLTGSLEVDISTDYIECKHSESHWLRSTSVAVVTTTSDEVVRGMILFRSPSVTAGETRDMLLIQSCRAGHFH